MEKMMQVTSQLLCNTFSPFSLSGDWLCDFLTFEPPSSAEQASSYSELPPRGCVCGFVGVQSTILRYWTYVIYNLPIFLLLTLLTLFGSSPAHYQLPRDYHVLIEILTTAWEKKMKGKEKGVKTKNGQIDVWQTASFLSPTTEAERAEGINQEWSVNKELSRCLYILLSTPVIPLFPPDIVVC